MTPARAIGVRSASVSRGSFAAHSQGATKKKEWEDENNEYSFIRLNFIDWTEDELPAVATTLDLPLSLWTISIN